MTMLVHNARIWTGSGDADWMTFDPVTGYVLEVGSGSPPFTTFPTDRQVDCRSAQVFPGFHESHIHLLEHGKILSTLNLHGCTSIIQLQERLEQYSKDNPDREWVFGNNWNQNMLGQFPDRFDLDKVCSDRPVFLRRVCIHIAVVNSKGLELLGITKDTPQPDGGIIDVYPKGHSHCGEPTGILRENAMFDNIVKVHFSSAEKKAFIRGAFQEVLKNGVTSVHTLEQEAWMEYCDLADEGELPMRVFYGAYWSCRHSDNFPPGPHATRGHMLSCSRVKLFTDGALGISTAALSQPYIGTCNCGIFMHKQEDLTSLVSEATKRGFRLEIHCIGDAAAEAALIALEQARVAPEKRPVFAHCQVLRADLVPRLAARGVVATIQPQFVFTDCQVVDKLLPPSLIDYSYAWKTLLQNGVMCAGSSDAPVEEPRPLLGMYDSIYRQAGTRDSTSKHCFRPEECLNLTQAVDLYTKAGAYTAMREHDLGQLLPGFKADFVVLEGVRDLKAYPGDLLEAQVTEVWVDGQRKL